MTGDGFTPIERRMLDLLAGGMPHSREELRECVGNEQSSWQNLNDHLYRLRRKIQDRRIGIVCELVHRRICYRLVGMYPASP